MAPYIPTHSEWKAFNAKIIGKIIDFYNNETLESC